MSQSSYSGGTYYPQGSDASQGGQGQYRELLPHASLETENFFLVEKNIIFNLSSISKKKAETIVSSLICLSEAFVCGFERNVS